MICEIVTLRNGEEVVTEIVTLKDGVVTAESTPVGSPHALKDLMSHANRVGDKRVTFQDDPVAWFKALPENWRGDYVWTRMVPDAGDAESSLKL